MSIKNQRLNSIIAKEISDIITFEIKDPNINLVSITEVNITNDLSYAKVFVSIIDQKRKKNILNALNQAKGFVKKKLSKRLSIRKIPELNFIYDDSLDKASRIENILKKVKKQGENMLKVDLEHIIYEPDFKQYESKVKKIDSDLKNKLGKGSDYTGWLDWPSNYDKEEVLRIKECAKRLRKISDVILICGIGGSYLGAKSAIDMIKGHYYKDDVEIIFCGNTFSSTEIVRTLEYLEGKDVSLNCISKSGQTTETSLAFRIFRQYIEKRYGKEESVKRIVITTDAKKGLLRPLCESAGYESFVIPDDIGGRFSVITAVGLLPMACAGIDIDEFINGVLDSAKKYDNDNLYENDAYKYAVCRNYLLEKGYKSEMYVSYELSMAAFAEWLKQLFGESEGKDGKGLLPTSVVNSTDLHSMGQFVQQGSKILFETIIDVEKPIEDMVFPDDEDNFDKMNYLSGKSLNWINKQAYKATLQAHEKDGNVPNIIINLESCNAYGFGYLVFFYFKVLAMSAYLLDVNPFDQPGVEVYKSKMYKLLGKPLD